MFIPRCRRLVIRFVSAQTRRTGAAAPGSIAVEAELFRSQRLDYVVGNPAAGTLECSQAEKRLTPPVELAPDEVRIVLIAEFLARTRNASA
jgi:hypothetical protein